MLLDPSSGSVRTLLGVRSGPGPVNCFQLCGGLLRYKYDVADFLCSWRESFHHIQVTTNSRVKAKRNPI
jgi:hypothetical protein